jgi:hypothetical protein
LARSDLFIGRFTPFSSLQAGVRFSHSLVLQVANYVCLTVSLAGLAGHDVPQGPDWGRLTILFLWYLSGIPTAYMMGDSCSVGAPGTWARALRVFIEGIVAFGLGGVIYVGTFPFCFRVSVFDADEHFSAPFCILVIGPVSVPQPPLASCTITVLTRKGAARSIWWCQGQRYCRSSVGPTCETLSLFRLCIPLILQLHGIMAI